MDDIDRWFGRIVAVMLGLADKAVADGVLTAEDRALVHIVAADLPTWRRLDAAMDRETAAMLEEVQNRPATDSGPVYFWP